MHHAHLVFFFFLADILSAKTEVVFFRLAAVSA
jgi:hypothetical protein